ncbi:hypothetical protein CR162_00820 [Pseudoroseomonas rhizosphaerae]|uniref:Yip1 domain-containing protein n=1 Tax=Teichococcus rhizosphaerae TaxID=1335062 RepID=A0A2C7AFU3_9PROT|nr:hypothetical protein [Pseudoroseomonas rhizosphaerae]PHK96949.1 hypothetical protein CR162_00820 [Pseudoroseomonas rhizosphaerae]
MLCGLRGALELARGRPAGLRWFPTTPEGALRSFWAAALCVPVFLLLRLLLEPLMLLTPRGVAAEGIGYVAGWAAYALASRHVARLLGRGGDWPRFIAAWNWATALQYGAVLFLSLIALPLPEPVQDLLSLGIIGYTLWLEWFVARHALRLPVLPAASLVLLDLFLSLFLTSVIMGLSRGG